MYFPLMGEDNKGNKWGYDRFDDIWAGIFAKKIMDHLGYGVVNGSPFVEHRKASDPFKNLQKEAIGIETNEILWKHIDGLSLSGNTTLLECYKLLANNVSIQDTEYFSKLKQAMKIWVNFFK